VINILIIKQPIMHFIQVKVNQVKNLILIYRNQIFHLYINHKKILLFRLQKVILLIQV